ncbi:hypothetical protein SDC9_62661 [bioreactor metagenome]|uniref:Uncharacterized protein n=1 Tax=bioreactor metagenome TaxID=1076179 RepID=A0A644XPV7_9ZZZZ
MQAYYFGHHPANFGRRVKLSLAFAALAGEMFHQVLVGIAHQVVVVGAVLPKIQSGGLKHSNQITHRIDQILAFTEFLLITEIGHIDHAA